MSGSNTPTLQFVIDSSEARRARDDLRDMYEASGRASESAQRLGQAYATAASGTQAFSQQTQDLTRYLGASVSALDMMIDRMRSLTTVFAQSGSGFSQLREVTTQVDSLGRMFNVTAAGIEDFNRAARNTGLSANETLTALRNMQAALEGVTTAGRAARQVLTGYGVDFQGIGPNNPGELLTRARAALNGYSQDPGTQRDMAAVFGSMSPESMTTFRQSDLRMPWQRDNDAAMAETARRTALARDAAIPAIQQQRQNSAQLAAFQDRYDEWWSPIGRLFSSQPESQQLADFQAREARTRNSTDPFLQSLHADIDRTRQGAMSYEANQINLGTNYEIQRREGVQNTTPLEAAMTAMRRFASVPQFLTGNFSGALSSLMTDDASSRFNLGSLENWWSGGSADSSRFRLDPRAPMPAPINERLTGYNTQTAEMFVQGSESPYQRAQRQAMQQAAQDFNVSSAGFGAMLPGQMRAQFSPGQLASIDDRRRVTDQVEREGIASRMQTPLLVSAMQSRAQTTAIGGGAVDLADQPQYAQLMAEAMTKFRNDADKARDYVREIATQMQATEQAATNAFAARTVAATGANTSAMGWRQGVTQALAAGASPDNGNITLMGLNRYIDSHAEQMLTDTQRAGAAGMIGVARTNYINNQLTTEQRAALNQSYMQDRQGGTEAQVLSLNTLGRLRPFMTDPNPANAQFNTQMQAYLRAAMNPDTEAQAPLIGLQAGAMFGIQREAAGARGTLLNQQSAAMSAAGAGYFLGGGLPGFSAPQPTGGAGAMSIAQQAMQAFPGLRVTSGYRDPATNAAVGGAANSQHMGGAAVDLDLAMLPEDQRAALIGYLRQNPALGGMGMYGPDSTSLHIDTRAGARAAWGPSQRADSLDQTPGYFQQGMGQWLSASRAGAAPSGPARAGGIAALGDLSSMTEAQLRSRVYGGGVVSAYAATQGALDSNQLTAGQAPERFETELGKQFNAAVSELARAASKAALDVTDLGDRAKVAGGSVYEQQRLAVQTGARDQGASALAVAEAMTPGPQRDAAIQNARGLQGKLETIGYERIAAQNTLQYNAQGKDLTARQEDAQFLVDNSFLSSPTLAQGLAAQRMRRQLQDSGTYSQQEINDRVAQAGKVGNLEEQARQNQLLRDSFVSIGDAGVNALDAIAVRGARTNDAMKQLLSTTTTIFERLATRRIMNGVLDEVGGWLNNDPNKKTIASGEGGLLTSAGGLISKGASAVGDAASGAASWIGSLFAAQGAVFSAGQVIPMAQGGTIHRSPAYIPMANGGTALVGEAGEEAAVPLVRGPDGKLGIANYGGGGGPVFHVHVNAGGSSGNSAQDTAHAHDMGKQITAQLRGMVVDVLRDQLRPGGLVGAGTYR